MKALLIYPNTPDTFWSFKHSLKFISKKAVHPPLGLITIAALLPDNWELRLRDLNVSKLRQKDLDWADIIFISAMSVHRQSVWSLICRCKSMNLKIVAGGPLFTSSFEEFTEIDHFVLNEAEITLPMFLKDLEAGRPDRIYRTDQFTDPDQTPIPRWDLIQKKKYVAMNLQFSRGCPYNCEFCDITTLFGKRVRSKQTACVIAELESLYRTGWRGDVFIVDDNFIGNRQYLENDVLPAIISWMKSHRYPFNFSTEVSIDLADHSDLMILMIKAGFSAVFVGIESTDDASLAECGKGQNRHRDLLQSVRKIQRTGLLVRGGFIVGFDSDTPSTFERQTHFIQRSGIVTAMVGLLNAPRGSRLYQRLIREGRYLHDISGDNTDLTINFIPKMGYQSLINGYQKLISSIYSPHPYYQRVRHFIQQYKPEFKTRFQFHPGYLKYHSGYLWAFMKSLVVIGIFDKTRLHFWKLLFWTGLRKPSGLIYAITFSIYGHHFRKIFADCL